jgi:hypothetical protein
LYTSSGIKSIVGNHHKNMKYWLFSSVNNEENDRLSNNVLQGLLKERMTTDLKH